MNEQQQLEQFIKKEQRKKVPIDRIVSHLLDNGFAEKEVRAALITLNEEHKEHHIFTGMLTIQPVYLLLGFFLLTFLTVFILSWIAVPAGGIGPKLIMGGMFGLYSVVALLFASAIVFFSLKFLDSQNNLNTLGNCILSQIGLLIAGAVVSVVMVLSLTGANVVQVAIATLVLNFLFGLLIYSSVFALPLLKSFALMAIITFVYWLLSLFFSMMFSFLFKLALMGTMAIVMLGGLPI